MRIYKAEEVSKMLLEFKCSNHRSIKEKVNFSLIAGSDNTSEELLKEFGNYRVLRSAVIYGANGSGKVILSVLCRSCVIWLAIVLIISRGKEYFRCVIN